MNVLLDEVSNLPEGLNAVIETNILKEVQKWAKEFSKRLKYLTKMSNKSLEQANQSLVDINKLFSIINGFTKHWLVQLFSTQLTRVRNEVSADKSKHETKINNNNLKIVNKSLKKNKDDWILLDDLSVKSGIDITSLKRIIDPILNEHRKYGFLDGRFVVFTEQILLQADNFLSDLILTIEQNIDQNISTELEEDILQGLDYCNFLIRGYSNHDKRYQGQEIIQKKEYLLEEKRNLKL